MWKFAPIIVGFSLYATKPTHKRLDSVVLNIKTKIINKAIKSKPDDGVFTWVGNELSKDYLDKNIKISTGTYDYVVCKIGIIKVTFNNIDNKTETQTIYTLGMCNKWLDNSPGDQEIMKNIVNFNDNVFRKTLNKLEI
jgi:hypothetical protein